MRVFYSRLLKAPITLYESEDMLMKHLKQRLTLFVLTCMILSLFSVYMPIIAAAENTTPERLGEIVYLRETNSETYLLSDRTYECVVYAEDKYYQDNSGVLQLIDNSLQHLGSSATSSNNYRNTANAFDVSFSSGITPSVAISLNNSNLSFSAFSASGGNSNHINADDCVAAIGAVNNCAILDELTHTGSNTLTYSNAFYNTDLVYVLSSSALKEYIVLKNNNAPNTFSFLFSLNNLTLQTSDNGTYFSNASGTPVFTLSDLFAIDSNGVLTGALSYSFVPLKDTGEYLITITLDPTYLYATDRVFPVIIDPTIMISSSNTADACVCSGYPTTNYQMATQLRTGYDSDYGIRRTYIKFDIPSSIPAGSVTNATLDIEKVSGATPSTRAYRCTNSWTSGSITWNNKPGYSTVNLSSESVPYRTGSAWYTMNVTNLVRDWVNENYANYGFVIKDNKESDPNHWTTFYSSDASSPHKPELHITYAGSKFWGCKEFEPESNTSIHCLQYATFKYYEDDLYDPSESAIAATTTSEELLALTQQRMSIWLNTHFPGKWSLGSLDSELMPNQWLIAIRVGILTTSTGLKHDYHVWYRTNTGEWAHKEAAYAAETLGSDLPTNDDSEGWRNVIGMVYDSDPVYYILSE